MGELNMKVNLVDIYIDDEIKRTVLETLDSRKYIKGENTREFEENFAKMCNTSHAVAVSSGTAALHLVARAMGIKAGDEVIMPAFTFIATACAAVDFGAKPIFADIDPITYTMDIEDVKRKITDKTKAIVPVHLYGHPVDMDPLMELAEEKGIQVIEDACQAHAAEYKGNRIGSIGDAGCFSFYPSKNMTVAGDGGMVVSKHPEIAEKVRMIRDQGRKTKYEHEIFGFNFRMSEIHAGVGKHHLSHLEDWTEARRKNAAKYTELLRDVDGIIKPTEAEWAKHVYHLYVIRVKEREKMSEFLGQQGISTVMHYPVPVHKQPAIMDLYGETSLPKTEECSWMMKSRFMSQRR
jgi:dTDP-4-amino-4,6-dideoxygalactose transaminase